LNNSTKPSVIGLDLGSSYIKAVSLRPDGGPDLMAAQRTGYDYVQAVSTLLAPFEAGASPFVYGVTGYGRNLWPGIVQKTEISALVRAASQLGITGGTLIDIGGQDAKIITLEAGQVKAHALNRRCAAGTGAYLEFIAHRLNLDPGQMNRLAAAESGIHPLNSFCTVFAGTEIIDCLNRRVPLPQLLRGLYAAVVERTREIAPLISPLFLSGGVIAHHPVLRDIFQAQMSKSTEIQVLPQPQFLAAWGMALLAREKYHEPEL